MERQSASHAELLRQQNTNHAAQLQQQAQAMEQQRADHAAQIDRLLSSQTAAVSSPAVSQPVPSVDAVMEQFGKANAVTDAKTGLTALHAFAQAGHIVGIKALFTAGADPNLVDAEGDTPLHVAAMHDHGEAVRLLAAAGAHLEERNIENNTPLLTAVIHRGDNYKATQALIEAGANVNVRTTSLHMRCSALHIAAFGDSVGCVKALLAARADVHATNNNGETPLNYASSYCQTPVSIVELLLEAGSDIESRNFAGSTPLIRAATNANHSVLSYLISKGANINAKSDGGKTALLRSVEGNELESVRILLKAGADVTIADNNGLTPAKAAMEKEDSAEMLQLLLSGGGAGVKREVSS